MKLANIIFEGSQKLPSEARQGGARFIIRRVTASLEREGRAITPEAIIREIERMNNAGWSQETLDHAIQLVMNKIT